MHVTSAVHLVPWAAGDLPLLQRLVGDPEMMRHLGGAESPERIADRQARYERSAGGVFKIVDTATGAGAGWVGYWKSTWREDEILETGWAVLPSFQGRGMAAAATAQAIARARSEHGHRFMHAFPAIANGPSNAICRKLGFSLAGPCELEYPPGHLMQCNDWRLDLRDPAHPPDR